MSILNVNQLQPIGGGNTITVSASDVNFSGNISVGSSFIGIVTASTAALATTAILANTATVATNAQGLTGTPDITVNNIQSGVVTATTFIGDGSGITGVTASGSGINIKDSASTVGVAATIDFGTNLNVSPASAGIVTVTVGDTDFAIADKIIHTGDTNTAIRFPAADTITAETGGDERLRITSDGKIGIGTDDPQAQFDMLHGAIRLSRTASYTSHVEFGITHASSSDYGSLYFDNTNATGDYVFRTTSSNSERLRITSDGKIGIGTDNPQTKLELFTNDDTDIQGDSGTNNQNSILRLFNKNGTDDTAVNNYVGIRFDVSNGATSSAWLDYVRTGNNQGAFLFKARNTASSYPELMRITSDGTILAGGQSSSYDGGFVNLELRKDSNTVGGSMTLVNDTASQAGATCEIDCYQNYRGAGKIVFGRENANNWQSSAGGAASFLAFHTNNAGTIAEKLRITSDGKIGVNNTSTPGIFSIHDSNGSDCKLLLTSTWTSGTQQILFGGGSTTSTGQNGSTAGVIKVESSAPGGAATGSMHFFYNPGDSLKEGLRITSEGHKFTNEGSIFHGSNDITDFTGASRNTNNNISIRAGYAGGDAVPTNRTSAIKIYPAGTRNATAGTLTGGIAWQHLDLNNSSWSTAYGEGAQIWMGAAIHDVPGQERDRFNLWMNSSTTGNSNPNNLAIEAYPNGMVRHPKVPAFMVRNTNGSSAFSANAVAGWNTVILNNGSSFGSNKFTAPVDGIYHFNCQMLSNNNTRLFQEFRVNQSRVDGTKSEGHALSGSYQTSTITMTYFLNANDYVDVYVSTNDAYGSIYANFNGFLVG